MDVDHNDFLSLTEFTDGLKKFGLTFPEKTVQELFTYIDKDCSGRILFDEFLQAIRVINIKEVHIRALHMKWHSL